MTRVSIIIASLNSREFLPKAIESVFAQSFQDLELVVCDGASTDGTVEYLRSLNDPRLIWRSEKDGGITQAWNKALTLATGEWLLFLGADDYLWDSTVLERVTPLLQDAGPDVKFAFGDVALVAAHGSSVIDTAHYSLEKLLRDIRTASGLALPHQGFFHHRRAFRDGPFDTEFRLCADYELITRCRRPADFLFLPVGIVTAFRMGGLTTNPWASLRVYRERARVEEKHGRSRLRVSWQLAKAYAKLGIRRVLGDGFTFALVNASRRVRGLPPYPNPG